MKDLFSECEKNSAGTNGSRIPLMPSEREKRIEYAAQIISNKSCCQALSDQTRCD
jgi:hypothetical protein